MAYHYKPVTRVVTIEFRPVLLPKGGFEVVVTPESAVVRYGDIIQWNVQGAPRKASVTVGDFAAFGPCPTLKSVSRRIAFKKANPMKDENVVIRKDMPTYDLTTEDPGVYKYAVKVNGTVVLDPDVEIKGPRG
jgi:hypothetical protein